MPAKINTLPPELMYNIIKWLPVLDVKNATLVSRAWATAGQRCLFRTVVLRMNLLSYYKLREILRHSTFGKYIQYIIYDLRTVQGNAADEGLTRWKKNIAGSGLGLPRRTIKELLKQLSPEQVEIRHRNFCRYLDNQESIKEFKDEVEILYLILKRLPNLKGLEYSYQQKAMDDSLQAPNFASLGPMAQWMLVEPDTCMGEATAEKRFLLWSNFIARSRTLGPKGSPIKELCLKDFKVQGWRTFAGEPLLRGHKQFLALLERLFITAKSLEQKDYDGFLYLLDQTRNLKLLDLTCGVLGNGDLGSLKINLRGLINEKKQWSQLTTLSLDGFVTSEEYLRHLLRRLAPSLRTLSLANIKFQRHTPLCQNVSQSTPIIQCSCAQGSWINFIIFLHKYMKLTSVSLQGRLSNSWSESWIVARYRSGDCLKNRVECYGASASCSVSEFPFRPKATKEVRVKARMKAKGKVTGSAEEEAILYRGCPWAVEDDESWRFGELT
jgi:hypothetical protein